MHFKYLSSTNKVWSFAASDQIQTLSLYCCYLCDQGQRDRSTSLLRSLILVSFLGGVCFFLERFIPGRAIAYEYLNQYSSEFSYCDSTEKRMSWGDSEWLHSSCLDIPTLVLSNRPRKTEYMKKLLRVLGFTNVTFPSLLLSSQVDWMELRQQGFIDEKFLAYFSKRYMLTEMSTTLNHVRAVQTLASLADASSSSSSHDYFLVFEDDVAPTIPYDDVVLRLKKMIMQLPATADILHLEYCYDLCDDLDHRSISPFLSTSIRPYCLASVLYTRRGLKKIRETYLRPLLYGEFDNVIARRIYTRDLEGYKASPILFVQDDYWGSTVGRNEISLIPSGWIHRQRVPECAPTAIQEVVRYGRKALQILAVFIFLRFLFSLFVCILMCSGVDHHRRENEMIHLSHVDMSRKKSLATGSLISSASIHPTSRSSPTYHFNKKRFLDIPSCSVETDSTSVECDTDECVTDQIILESSLQRKETGKDSKENQERDDPTSVYEEEQIVWDEFISLAPWRKTMISLISVCWCLPFPPSFPSFSCPTLHCISYLFLPWKWCFRQK